MPTVNSPNMFLKNIKNIHVHICRKTAWFESDLCKTCLHLTFTTENGPGFFAREMLPTFRDCDRIARIWVTITAIFFLEQNYKPTRDGYGPLDLVLYSWKSYSFLLFYQMYSFVQEV